MLLKQAGFDFSTWTAEVDESYPADLRLEMVPEYLAEKKARHFLDRLSNEVLISSDTVVLLNGKLLEKPNSREEAQEMLLGLSGNKHTVISGVCLATCQSLQSFSEHTEVYFRALDLDEIDYYIDHYKPFDKAGSYGIQEWIGYIGIEQIKGSFFNVMGLPIQRLYVELKKLNDEL